MKLSATVCLINLVVLGICGGVRAFSGFDLLGFLWFGSVVAMRAFLGICFVSALFCLYALIAFRPFRWLR